MSFQVLLHLPDLVLDIGGKRPLQDRLEQPLEDRDELDRDHSRGYITGTEFFRDKLTGQRRDALIAATSTGRAGTPRDVAGTVHFLASPAARHITGQVIATNGGAHTTR